MSYKANASATVAVKVQCERCQHVYEYDVTLSASRTSITESRTPEALADECAKEITEQMRACHEGKHLGLKKCPKCSYLQSWMLQAQKDNREMNQLIWSALLSIGTCVLLYNIGFTIPWSWRYLWLLVFVAIALTYHWFLWLISTIVRRPEHSRDASRHLTRPLDIRISKEPVVSVVRETVY